MTLLFRILFTFTTLSYKRTIKQGIFLRENLIMQSVVEQHSCCTVCASKSWWSCLFGVCKISLCLCGFFQVLHPPSTVKKEKTCMSGELQTKFPVGVWECESLGRYPVCHSWKRLQLTHVPLSTVGEYWKKLNANNNNGKGYKWGYSLLCLDLLLLWNFFIFFSQSKSENNWRDSLGFMIVMLF